MTIRCRDFVVLIRSDNPIGAGSQWFVLDSFTTPAAALALLDGQRRVGKIAKIVRQ